ncbi:hypothetical protein A7982_12721 [Minicystis rosea]|nr:hypothetical protein A7982_12721 [Minicystis rosea]
MHEAPLRHLTRCAPSRRFFLRSLAAANYARAVRARGVFLLLLAGCLPAAEPSSAEPRPLVRTGNAWSDCYRRFHPGDDPSADLARLAAACAAPSGMRPLTPVRTGAAAGPSDRPDRFQFRVRRGHCYRGFAVGAPGVEDLDVAVYDAHGDLATADVSRDRWPVVPPRGPACAEEDGIYSVAVAVTRGRGDYVLQIWGTDGTAP